MSKAPNRKVCITRLRRMRSDSETEKAKKRKCVENQPESLKIQKKQCSLLQKACRSIERKKKSLSDFSAAERKLATKVSKAPNSKVRELTP